MWSHGRRTQGHKETGKLWSTQTIAQSLLGLEGHSGFGFHMHSALCCTSHYKKENALVDSLLSSPLLSILRSSFQQNCESVLYCVDTAFLGETNRAWQSGNKQSADVCVGIVWEIMLTRRHFSLIQILSVFFHIQRKEEKQACVRSVKLLHGPAFTTSIREKYHILKTSRREWALPLF